MCVCNFGLYYQNSHVFFAFLYPFYEAESSILVSFLIYAVSFSLVSRALVLWFHMFSTGNFQRPQRLLQPVDCVERKSKWIKLMWRDIQFKLKWRFWFTDQFRLFGINPHYHVLIRCRQQVTNPLFRYAKFLVTLIILRKHQNLVGGCKGTLIHSSITAIDYHRSVVTCKYDHMPITTSKNKKDIQTE